jgi:hypothetical protein
MKVQLLCLISILLLSATSIAPAEEVKSATRWEYKVWVQPDDVNEISGKSRIESELNNLGSQGWELVSVVWKKHADRTSPEGRAIHYFKRALPLKRVEETGKPSSKKEAEQ